MSKMIVEKYSDGDISVKNGENGAIFEVRLGVANG